MVDLCAAPGGWSEVCRASAPSAVVVAVDLAAIAPLPGVHCIQGDLTHPSTVSSILGVLECHSLAGADVVLCDAAPDVLHQTDVDEMLQHQLVRAALSVARRTLRANGSFVCKVFRGPQLSALLATCQRAFGAVEVAKPTASRNASLEAFIVATQYEARNGDSSAAMDETSADSDSDSRDGDIDDSDNESATRQQSHCVAVPFVSCGDEMGLDSDQTYPLSFRVPNTNYTAYQPLAPAAAPIEPPYQQSIRRQRDKANSRNE